jgi:hypothetical protein
MLEIAATEKQRVLGRLVACKVGDQAPVCQRDRISIDNQERAGATAQRDHLAVAPASVSIAGETGRWDRWLARAARAGN